MATTITQFQGLTFSILVEEFHDKGTDGRLNCYLASIYTQDKATAVRHLVRRSRLPGAASAMKREIEREGIKAFHRLRGEKRHDRVDG
ncbi:hypothetical protein [Rhizobium metallidurans]|uniref:Uncharacterized protein n=1 Tax=Rhizobium metallidurans TaxID=1265931 RepID=A0A7W6CR98_9HYPH|nr:hypothetical protein [Rhizobium metallidurans]MBB3965745.1 hypothetical protein [Rhizobium metallidurans]